MTSRHETPMLKALLWLPAPAFMIAAVAGTIVALVAIAKGIQDPDYFWHVTTGAIIARERAVPSVDPFSFTWGGQPWTPHEWLSELIMYLLVAHAGEFAALVVFGLLAAAAFGVLVAALRSLGVGSVAIGSAIVVPVLIFLPYVTVRPQVISWLMLAALLALLIRLHHERARRAFWMIPVFILWANLHGLYVIGLGVVGIYVLFTLAGRTPMTPARWHAAAAGIGAGLASMVTPAGPVGILYPLRYVQLGDWGLANIQEWQSPNFHQVAHLPLLALIVAVGLLGTRRSPGWLVALAWIGIAAALLALRNAPIAALLAAPALALGIEDALAGRLRPRGTLSVRIQLRRRVMETVTTGVILLAAAAVLLPVAPVMTGDDPIAARYPVAGVDRLRELEPEARVFAEYGWAGYVISRMYWDGGTVFVDGRNDMYDQETLQAYSMVRDAEDGWREILDSHLVDAIIVPPRAPIARGPAEAAGWCIVYEDEVHLLLMRSCP